MARPVAAPASRLDRLVAGLPVASFLRFGAVGTVGFVTNVAAVYAVRAALGLYAAGLVGYCLAATVTWLLNRVWTFRDGGRKPALQQWTLYLAANAVGFAVYYATYALAISYLAACARWPVLAVALGAGLSLFVNFSISYRVVFR